MAGELRTVEVWIGSSSQEAARFVPPPADQVLGRLSELLDCWKTGFAILAAASTKEQVRGLAKFHHDFLSIHPFTDGNGTMSRLILAMQIRDLTGASVSIDLDGPEYFDALSEADAGSLESLEALIRPLVPPCGAA